MVVVVVVVLHMLWKKRSSIAGRPAAKRTWLHPPKEGHGEARWWLCWLFAQVSIRCIAKVFGYALLSSCKASPGSRWYSLRFPDTESLCLQLVLRLEDPASTYRVGVAT